MDEYTVLKMINNKRIEEVEFECYDIGQCEYCEVEGVELDNHDHCQKCYEANFMREREVGPKFDKYWND